MTQVPPELRLLDLTGADKPGHLRHRDALELHVFLTAQEVIARYGWGRTKGYRILRAEGFPRPIGGDRYRLDTLIAWENEQLRAPRTIGPAPALPPRKRRRSRSA